MNTSTNAQKENLLPDMDGQERLLWGSKVAAVRARRELTQSQLAEIAGVSRGTVANIESGMTPQVETLWAVMQALDMTPDPLDAHPAFVQEHIRILAPLIAALPDDIRGKVMGEVIVMLGMAVKGSNA